MAKAFNIPFRPYFPTELHLVLHCAVPNNRRLEYISQLDTVISAPPAIENGRDIPSEAPGLSIAWDLAPERHIVRRAATLIPSARRLMNDALATKLRGVKRLQ
jgi:hypothetical protein